MKQKLLVLVMIMTMGFSAFAQKPDGNYPFSIEGGITLQALTGQTFAAPSLKMRYFLDDNLTARVGLVVNSQKNTDKLYGNNDAGFPVETKLATYEEKDFSTQISLGGAYHFSQTERLSPYAAVDVSMTMGSYSETWTNADQGLSAYDENRKGSNTFKYGGLGFMLSLGADYYFNDNIFIGLEIGMGMNSTKDKGGKWEETIGTTTTTIDTFQSFKESYFGNMSSQMIRLGWRF
jgi:outer membrane protein W